MVWSYMSPNRMPVYSLQRLPRHHNLVHATYSAREAAVQQDHLRLPPGKCSHIIKTGKGIAPFLTTAFQNTLYTPC